MAHLDRPMYLLGYLPGASRVYLIDKEFGIVGYMLLLRLIEYKTLVLRDEVEAAEEILPDIPQARLTSCLTRLGPPHWRSHVLIRNLVHSRPCSSVFS